MAVLNRFARLEECAAFADALGGLLSTGVPLRDAVSLVLAHHRFRHIQAEEILRALDRGKSLAEAVEEARFPPLYCAVIAAAESWGGYAESLLRLAEQSYRDLRWRRQMVQTAMYPLLVLFLLFLAMLFLMLVVLPGFAGLYDSFQVQLPWLTRLMLWFSRHFAWFFLVLSGALGLGWWWLRRAGHTWAYRLPGWRRWLRIRNTYYLSSQLAFMRQHGVDMRECLTILARSSPWPVLRLSCARMLTHLEAGGSLNAAFSHVQEVLDPFFPAVVAISEETGELTESLQKQALRMEHQTVQLTELMARYTEPALIALVGLGMAMAFVSLFYPMLNLLSQV